MRLCAPHLVEHATLTLVFGRLLHCLKVGLVGSDCQYGRAASSRLEPSACIGSTLRLRGEGAGCVVLLVVTLYLLSIGFFALCGRRVCVREILGAIKDFLSNDSRVLSFGTRDRNSGASL